MGRLPRLALYRHRPDDFQRQSPVDLETSRQRQRAAQKAAVCKPIDYPKPDGVLTFDRLSSVFLANLAHEENQPDHLVLNNPQTMIDVNYKEYASPETRYCPVAYMKSSKKTAVRACKSTRQTACTAKPATSKTRRKTSLGFAPKAQADRITAGCKPHSAVTPGQE